MSREWEKVEESMKEIFNEAGSVAGFVNLASMSLMHTNEKRAKERAEEALEGMKKVVYDREKDPEEKIEDIKDLLEIY